MSMMISRKAYLKIVYIWTKEIADTIVSFLEKQNEIRGGVDLRKLLVKKRKRKEHEWPDKWRNDYGIED